MSKLKVDELRSADRSVSDSANLTLADNGSTTIPNGTLSAGTIGSAVTFNPAIGQLAFYSHYHGTSSTISCTLDGTSSYLVIVQGRKSSGTYHVINLSFKIDSSDGTISEGSDPWTNDLNESFNNSSKVLTIASDGDSEIMNTLIFKGAPTEMT